MAGVVSSPLKESGNIDPVSSRPLRSSYSEGVNSSSSYGKVAHPPSSPTANLPDTVKMSQLGEKAAAAANNAKFLPDSKQPISILSNKTDVMINNNYTSVSVLYGFYNNNTLS